jgi:hypothetical protein
MSSVFVVIGGEYDDWSIEGGYTTKEKAEEMSKLAGGAYVREIELDTYPEHPEGTYLYQVEMKKTGEVLEVMCGTNVVYGREEVDPTCIDEVVLSAYFRMWARDREHAIEIANERRLKILAENKWYEDADMWFEEHDEKIN